MYVHNISGSFVSDISGAHEEQCTLLESQSSENWLVVTSSIATFWCRLHEHLSTSLFNSGVNMSRS